MYTLWSDSLQGEGLQPGLEITRMVVTVWKKWWGLSGDMVAEPVGVPPDSLAYWCFRSNSPYASSSLLFNPCLENCSWWSEGKAHEALQGLRPTKFRCWQQRKEELSMKLSVFPRCGRNDLKKIQMLRTWPLINRFFFSPHLLSSLSLDFSQD